MNTDRDNYIIKLHEERRARNRRPIKYPRPKRLIILDKETDTIHQVIKLNLDEKDPQRQCIVESRHFGRTYQLLEKVDFFLTNSKA